MIREVRGDDHPAIRRLLEAAFATPEEADIVERLRADGDMALELVAEDAGALLGHVAFSRMVEPEGALGLAPLAVAAPAAGRGIGSALTREGLKRVREAGATAVFVLGDAAYYRRFGFSTEAAAGLDTILPPEHMMALVWGPSRGRRIRYAPALQGE